MRKISTSRSDRARLREAQILDAAKHCFSRVGFHSSSMAQIAAQAQMSVGQIYRHFRSKEALIEGIVQQDIAAQSSYIASVSDEDLPDVLTAVGRNKDFTGTTPIAQHLALMLEIVAEAARNPKVREIVLSSQKRGHVALVKRLARAHPSTWSAKELDVRLRLVSAMLQGVVTQVVLDRGAPRAELLRRVNTLAKQLLTP